MEWQPIDRNACSKEIVIDGGLIMNNLYFVHGDAISGWMRESDMPRRPTRIIAHVMNDQGICCAGFARNLELTYPEVIREYRMRRPHFPPSVEFVVSRQPELFGLDGLAFPYWLKYQGGFFAIPRREHAFLCVRDLTSLDVNTSVMSFMIPLDSCQLRDFENYRNWETISALHYNRRFFHTTYYNDDCHRIKKSHWKKHVLFNKDLQINFESDPIAAFNIRILHILKLLPVWWNVHVKNYDSFLIKTEAALRQLQGNHLPCYSRLDLYEP